MDRYAAFLREVLQLAGEIYFRRVEAELWKFSQALDQWLHELFARPRPDWRESLDQLLSQQAAEGRVAAPESRWELIDFLEGWAKTVDWNSIEGGTSGDDRPTPVAAAAPEGKAKQPTQPRRAIGRFAPRKKYSRLSAEEAFFFKKLQEAKNQLDEMEQVLEALGRKLDAAQIDEEVDVDSEVDAIEALIWRHNDALESAREIWLRHDLGSRAFDRLTLMYSPAAFGLPLFTDEQQAERARVQWHKIARRLDQRIATFDRIILGMKVAEWAGIGASLALGAGVVLTAFKQGGKWAVVKTVAKVAASGAAAYGAGEAVEHGLRAAGASEETIHGVRLAAEVVTWLLLLRRVRSARAKATPRPTAAKPTVPKPSPATTTRKGSDGGTRPGSVSGNPENRLVETGVPLKGRFGWQKRWTRMTREDELRQAEAIRERYEQILKEAKNLPVSSQHTYIFEQMRRFRTQYRRDFLKNRKY